MLKRSCVWYFSPVGFLLNIVFQIWSLLCFTLQRVIGAIMTYVCVELQNTEYAPNPCVFYDTHTHSQRVETPAGFLSLTVCHMSWRVSYVWAAVAQLSVEMSHKHGRFINIVKLLLEVMYLLHEFTRTGLNWFSCFFQIHWN